MPRSRPPAAGPEQAVAAPPATSGPQQLGLAQKMKKGLTDPFKNDTALAFGVGLMGPNDALMAAYPALGQLQAGLSAYGAARERMKDRMFNLREAQIKSGDGGISNDIYGNPLKFFNDETGETIIAGLLKDGRGLIALNGPNAGSPFNPNEAGFRDVTGAAKTIEGTDGTIVWQGGKQVGFISKDRMSQQYDLENGKNAAEYLKEAPKMFEQGYQSLLTVQRVREAVESGELKTGVAGQMFNRTTPEGKAEYGKMKELIGESFLQAYEGLKGGGQITEIEGTKAQEAYQRLEAAMWGTKEQFFQALDEYESAIKSGLDDGMGLMDAYGGTSIGDDIYYQKIRSMAVEKMEKIGGIGKTTPQKAAVVETEDSVDTGKPLYEEDDIKIFAVP
jgi:hypothetical protein